MSHGTIVARNVAAHDGVALLLDGAAEHAGPGTEGVGAQMPSSMQQSMFAAVRTSAAAATWSEHQAVA
jgi:hypothetical protein